VLCVGFQTWAVYCEWTTVKAYIFAVDCIINWVISEVSSPFCVGDYKRNVGTIEIVYNFDNLSVLVDW
jgi:hypothetical protein